MSNSNSNRPNVVNSNLNDYESLYKVDLNFDVDVKKLNPDVLTSYIVRILNNHPYYVDVNNIVDILVNEEKNTVTVIVSTKEVQEQIVGQTNKITLDNLNRQNAMVNKDVKNQLNLLSVQYGDKKFVLETTNNDGKPRLYEYEFGGFKGAKNLFLKKV